MAANPHVVARIRTSPETTVAIEALAIDLPRRAAARLAADHCEREGEVVFIGSQRLREIDVRLPEKSYSFGLAEAPVLVARVTNWLTAVRADGGLRLGAFAAVGDAQELPYDWLTDPLVLASLGRLLAPLPPRKVRDVDETDAWIVAAPSGSVAALLRDSGQFDDFREWVAAVPPTARALLRVPLYQVESTASGGLRLGIVSRHEAAHPFLAGDGWQWDITPSGEIQPNFRALRRDEDWSLLDPAELRPTDRAWGIRGDPRLDQLFKRLPALAEVVLHHASVAAIEAGTRPAYMIAKLPPFRRRLSAELRGIGTVVTGRLLLQAGLSDLRAPRLSHALFLQASGNPIAAARRRQAIALWPALATDLARENAPRAAHAIDAATPLVLALARDYGVPAWTARRLLPLLRTLDPTHARLLAGPAGLSRLLCAAGPHAPPMTATELPLIAHWLRLLPEPLGGPWTRLLLQALGAEAALGGWEAVAELLKRPDIGDECMALLAWWDDLQHNAHDVLSRCPGSRILPEDVHGVIAAWTDDLPMSTLLRFAAGWRGFLWGAACEIDDPHPSTIEEIESVIGALTLVSSRFEVTPLASRAALQGEGEELQHCVGSYWRAVASSRRLVCALRCPDSGARATVAWTYRSHDGWFCGESRGLRNAPVTAGDVATALAELGELLADEARLHPGALARHVAASVLAGRRAADYLVEGTCLVSMLPLELAKSALSWLPGSGTLEKRVRIAWSQADRLRTSSECSRFRSVTQVSASGPVS
jgi:hypothetical protein